jgi:hypothetical protein
MSQDGLFAEGLHGNMPLSRTTSKEGRPMYMPLIMILLNAGINELAPDLAPGVRLEADGKPIDAGRLGHAAPCVADLYGRGVHDLLVGEFAEGGVSIYRNLASKGQPKLAAGLALKIGKENARVPTG